MDKIVIGGIIKNPTSIILLTFARFILDGSGVFAKSVHQWKILGHSVTFITNDQSFKSIYLDR